MNEYKREWTRGDTMRLIELYEAATSLWDVREEDYRNKVKKKKAYDAIAKEFCTSILEVKRKIHNLRSQWQAEFKRIKASLERADDERYVPTWWCFDSLNFLAVDNSEISDTLEKSQSYSLSPLVKQETKHEVILESLPAAQTESPSESEPESPKPMKKKKKMRRQDDLETTNLVPTAFVTPGNDDDQIFGDYVASVMRSLSETKKKKLRRKIQVAIVEVEEDDEVVTPSIKTSSPVW